jgi:hypothetical protein
MVRKNSYSIQIKADFLLRTIIRYGELGDCSADADDSVECEKISDMVCELQDNIVSPRQRKKILVSHLGNFPMLHREIICSLRYILCSLVGV